MISPIKITRAGAYLTPHIPFRLGFGNHSRMEVPKLVYWVEVEGGKKSCGVASEFAMVGWFDKKNNEPDYLNAITTAAGRAVQTIQSYYNGKPFRPFAAAHERGDTFRNMAPELGTTGLALQMIEALEGRAILDALGHLYAQNSLDLMIANQGFDLHAMDDTIREIPIEFILHHSSEVPEHLLFRHTVGLPDIIEGEHSLETDIRHHGLNRFKVKIDNDVDRNIDRLCQMAKVIEKYAGTNYVLTLDGNEAFDNWDDLIRFAERFVTHPDLHTMVKNTSYIEQPFNRDNLKKIDALGKAAIERLKREFGFAILIDESGDEHNSYKSAIELGILGGGMKLCKGLYKAVFDAAVALSHGNGCFNSFEDLTQAEPTDFPQAIHLASSLKVVPDAELNGAFKTDPGTWMTLDERRLAVKHMPGLYRLDGRELQIILSGNKYPTRDVLGIGLGSSVVCFAPQADESSHLRREISFVE